jgi:hypothetical protein
MEHSMVSRNKNSYTMLLENLKMWEIAERCEDYIKMNLSNLVCKLASFRIQFNDCDEPYDFIATGEFFKRTINIFCS